MAMGVRSKFSRGDAKSTICLSFSGCRWYNANGRSQNTLPFPNHEENPPCYVNSHKIAIRWKKKLGILR